MTNDNTNPNPAGMTGNVSDETDKIEMQRYCKEIVFPLEWSRTAVCRDIDNAVVDILIKHSKVYGVE